MVADTLSTAMVNRLSELVHIESPSGDADGIDKMLATLTTTHEELGGRVERIAADPTDHLVIHYGEPAEKTLTLVGHADTVWDRGTLASTVPWRVDGDTVAGPGAFDMKSGLVIIETAIRRLRDAGSTIRPTTVVITSDEEIGSATSTPLIEQLAAHTALALGFESPHPDGAFKVGRRGSTRVELHVTGKEAHAALDPDSGVSAIDELVDQLIRVRTMIADVQAANPDAVLCNPGIITGGTRANVIPGEASVIIGLRFTSPEVERDVLQRFAALTPVRPGASVRTTVLSNRPTWQPHPADAQALDAIRAIASGVGIHADGRPAAGAADTNQIGALGVPTLDGFGPRGGGAHAISEHISVASFVERAQLLTAILDASTPLAC